MIDASSLPVSVDPVALAAFCDRWRIAELAVFGSVLREDFGPDSDVDLLVTFHAGARHGLFAVAEMELELEGLFGRDVDLVTRRSVEESANWIRKSAILDTAVPLEVPPAGRRGWSGDWPVFKTGSLGRRSVGLTSMPLR